VGVRFTRPFIVLYTCNIRLYIVLHTSNILLCIINTLYFIYYPILFIIFRYILFFVANQLQLLFILLFLLTLLLTALCVFLMFFKFLYFNWREQWLFFRQYFNFIVKICSVLFKILS